MDLIPFEIRRLSSRQESIAEQIRARYVAVANLYAAHTGEVRICPIGAGIVKARLLGD